MPQRKLIGPFTQLLTMDKLDLKGPIKDNKLEIISNAGIVIERDYISEIGDFDDLAAKSECESCKIEEVQGNFIAMPGLIDPHTHICWGGNRSMDYTRRLQGLSYSEIASAGGGIWDTVTQTRKAYINDLTKSLVDRADRHLYDGVTTIEVKSGYGLSTEEELKILQAIKNASRRTIATLIPTCLAAHVLPRDFKGSTKEYLQKVLDELLPQVIDKGLAGRVDIYIDDHAFTGDDAKFYLNKARAMGYEITVHADQFNPGGSLLAIESDAVSADHLEVSGDKEIKLLASSSVIPVALPGASIGLGMQHAQARKLLDSGASLAIGSDWNPGSAPMGDLLVQAAILGMQEKLSNAETLSAITFRAAAALNLKDRGVIKQGNQADIIAFNFNDYREILYNQGKTKPLKIWKSGTMVK